MARELQGAVLSRSITMSEQSELTRSRIGAAWLFLAPMLFLLVLVAGWPFVAHHLVRFHRRQPG